MRLHSSLIHEHRCKGLKKNLRNWGRHGSCGPGPSPPTTPSRSPALARGPAPAGATAEGRARLAHRRGDQTRPGQEALRPDPLFPGQRMDASLAALGLPSGGAAPHHQGLCSWCLGAPGSSAGQVLAGRDSMLQPAPQDLVAHSPLPESSWWGQDSCLPPLPHRLWESRSGAAPHSVPCPPCPGQCQCWGTGRPPVHPALAGAQWVAGPALGSRLLQATPQLPAPKPNNCGSRNTRPTLVPSEAGCLQALETASRGGCLWPLEAALCTADMKLGPPALSWEQPGLGPLGGPLGGDMHQAETTDWPGGPCPVKGPLQTPPASFPTPWGCRRPCAHGSGSCLPGWVRGDIWCLCLGPLEQVIQRGGRGSTGGSPASVASEDLGPRALEGCRPESTPVGSTWLHAGPGG